MANVIVGTLSNVMGMLGSRRASREQRVFARVRLICLNVVWENSASQQPDVCLLRIVSANPTTQHS